MASPAPALQSTCRLCGIDRAIREKRQPLKKEVYRNDIQKIFDFDVCEDHSGCPPFICHPCSLRLKKMKKIRQGKQRGLGTAWDVPTFDPPHQSQADKGLSEETPSVDNSQEPTDTFKKVARSIAEEYGIIDVTCNDTLVFLTLECGSGDCLFKLEVQPDRTWRLLYRNLLVRHNVTLIQSLPEVLDLAGLRVLVQIMKNGYVCSGHAQGDFPFVTDVCKKKIKEGKALLKGQNQNEVVGFWHCGSFRHTSCEVLILKGSPGSNKCANCVQPEFRQSLRSREAYFRTRDQTSQASTSSSSKTPFSCLSPGKKEARLKNMSKAAHSLRHKVNRLKTKVEKLLTEDSVELTSEQSVFMEKITKESHSEVSKVWSEGSPQRLLWEQQVKRSQVKGPGGMRWHPTVIRWALSMYLKSPAAYKQLASSGFLLLPSQSTLKSYANFTEGLPGVNPEILQIVFKEFNLPHAQPFQKNVCLVWDEMKIKSGLVISKGSGRVVGFTSLDKVSAELALLSQLMGSKEREHELATHIIVFMVRGLMVHVNMPFIWYPCVGFSAEQLWGAVWCATHTLQNLGLSVRAWVCDGATPNRKFFRVHETTGGQYQSITYYTANRFALGQNIYFICDVPHLLKTVRNNLENSHGHNNSKSLMKNGQHISWSHIVSTVDDDMSHHLNRLPKIKEEHVHLSPQLRMRVRLASQVLSTTMANAIRLRDNPAMLETAQFCQVFDKWFDCLNGRYLKAKKPDLQPYFSNNPNDARYQWLEDYFLGWLGEWEGEIEQLPNLSKSERNRFLLSYQTAQGLKITTKSFLTLTPALLAEEGAQFFFPEKLNQDRLEVFFAKVRRGCGDSDNPTIDEARHRIINLLVAGRHVMAPRNANSVINEDDEQDTFMPKRRK